MFSLPDGTWLPPRLPLGMGCGCSSSKFSHSKSTYTLDLIYLISTSPINSSGPLTTPHGLYKDPWTLCLPCIHEQCSLENASTLLFVDRLYGPGPTCSTKTVQVILFYFLNQATVFPQNCPLSLFLPHKPHYISMNVHPSVKQFPPR